MSYYQMRRAELQGDRQRKPRRCDVMRMAAMERRMTRKRARMVAAANRLAEVWC